MTIEHVMLISGVFTTLFLIGFIASLIFAFIKRKLGPGVIAFPVYFLLGLVMFGMTFYTSINLSKGIIPEYINNQVVVQSGEVLNVAIDENCVVSDDNWLCCNTIHPKEHSYCYFCGAEKTYDIGKIVVVEQNGEKTARIYKDKN